MSGETRALGDVCRRLTAESPYGTCDRSVGSGARADRARSVTYRDGRSRCRADPDVARNRVELRDVLVFERGDVTAHARSAPSAKQPLFCVHLRCANCALGHVAVDPERKEHRCQSLSTYRLLRSRPAVQKRSSITARHTVQATLNLRTYRETSRFRSRRIAEQRAIAHILGTLDDKIELNRRMNETLEAMARALFKSWFVDFDPVRAKAEGRDPGLPKPLADLFPDSLRGLGAGRDSEGVGGGDARDVAT